MAVMRVNPTRVELQGLKRRLKTATQGHKLLKDKRDEMMRQYVGYIRKNRQLRLEVEALLSEGMASFVMARATMDASALQSALLCPTRTVELELDRHNVMSVEVPRYQVHEKVAEGASSYPYGLLSTSGELDESIEVMNQVLMKMVELAEMEKTCVMLADEIEKTRRRVNALEHVMIPNLEETIRYITMKLDENERGTLTRLMKVKSMQAAQQGT
jgi:V/A-type H+-transporting ATPase subunit D